MIKKSLKNLFALVFWFWLWAFASWRINKSILLPPPGEVLKRLSELLRETTFYETVFNSLINILLGFAVGVIFGVVCAVLCNVSKISDSLLRPAMTVIKSTPVASFIILALVFVGKKYVPTLICFMMVCPVVFGAVSNGISLRDKDIIEMLNTFNVKPLKKLVVFQIPSILPFLAEGCITSLGLAWKAGIAAEVLCTPKNTIGIELYESKLYLETTDVFCWTLVVIVLSLVLESVLKKIVSKIRKGETKSEKN